MKDTLINFIKARDQFGAEVLIKYNGKDNH